MQEHPFDIVIDMEGWIQLPFFGWFQVLGMFGIFDSTSTKGGDVHMTMSDGSEAIS